MSEFVLAHLWYIVLGFCVVAYTVLDGFDLGVGMLHIFTKKDVERRLLLNSIGPVWDGNEVWLVIIGGALFAGFPEVYATLCSGFYDICMIMLLALIFRPVAIEFRSKRTSMKWRGSWDWVFSMSSYVLAFGAGMVLGNLVQGIHLDRHKDFYGTAGMFFRPYPLLMGITSVALFMMHGAMYLVMKTEGLFQEQMRRWAYRCMSFFMLCYFLMTAATLVYMPHMGQRMAENYYLFILPVLAFLTFFNISREFNKGNEGRAFLSSCVGIALLLGLFGIGTYPMIVRSSIDPQEHSLTIMNSASSVLTLKVLLIIVLIGVPLVLCYGVYIYRIFRGKVKLGPSSY
jgi:cytochrome bd ubiquinol oxidase subunit II